MRKSLLCLFAAAALAVTSCYDDTELKNRVETLESDVKGLKELVSTLNTNVGGLQSLVSALQQNNFITSVAEVKDNATGAVIGYTISFTKGSPITIYHGEKGNNGSNGKDGKTPVIGVTLIDGVYYWTIDGSILKDSEGNNVPATGPQGEQGNPGTPGTPGNDGVTPTFRITDGYWELSIDNGQTWERLGPATGDSEVTAVDAVFSGVKETSEGVQFTLVDGSKIIIPREKKFAVEIDNSKVYDVVAGSSTEIPYTVVGGDEETVVDAFASGNWYAEAVAADAASGCIKVSVPADGGDKGKVLVFAANGNGKTDIKTVSFAKGTVSFVAPTTIVPVTGGDLS
ncbi:MAG: DUF4988 domain-containing protein, partial [Bacteroidales bacterium]|nr:DUF4988 domain-containing protein [Bacteroidales bacterium]